MAISTKRTLAHSDVYNLLTSAGQQVNFAHDRLNLGYAERANFHRTAAEKYLDQAVAILRRLKQSPAVRSWREEAQSLAESIEDLRRRITGAPFYERLPPRRSGHAIPRRR